MTDDSSPTLRFNAPREVQEHLLSLEDILKHFNDHIFQDISLEKVKFQIHAYYKYPIERKETYNLNINQGFVEPFNASSLSSVKVSYIFLIRTFDYAYRF